jgi:hypothetical protein
MKAPQPTQRPNEGNDAVRPLLVLAPHLQYPTRDGANISVDRLWGELSRFISYVDIVGANEFVRYVNGDISHKETYSNSPRSKISAALRTIFLFSHYNKEKFVTPAFSQFACTKALQEKYQAVVYSYLTTASIDLPQHHHSLRQYVLSHNDDVKIFTDMRASSANPAQKLVAYLSERWVRRFGRSCSILRYIHCTEADAAGWHRAIGPHDYLIGEVGCDLPAGFVDKHEPLKPERPIRLIFVGSLGVRMNFDAIQYFARRFFPVVHSRLNGALEIKVIGSNPSPELARFCRSHNFSLHPNVSDEELDQHFDWADFSILPFEYSNGTKLKLLTSTSRGVPALMTSAVGGGPGSDHPLCLISDDPCGWASHIDQLRNKGITTKDRHSLFEISKPWSWRSMAERFFVTELAGVQMTTPNWQ